MKLLINIRVFIIIWVRVMMQETGFENIWELYGVRENPFSTAPILVVGGTIPIESFVGRGEHVKRLKKVLGAKGGSRTLVYGDVGVGKTTFVNVVRSQAMKTGFFTPFKEIDVYSEWDSDALIKNTLAAIFATMKLIQKKPISDVTYAKLQHLVELEFKERHMAATVVGIGGGYGSDITPNTEPTTFILQNFFQEIISEIFKNTKKEVIIHYNNLELLPNIKGTFRFCWKFDGSFKCSEYSTFFFNIDRYTNTSQEFVPRGGARNNIHTFR